MKEKYIIYYDPTTGELTDRNNMHITFMMGLNISPADSSPTVSKDKGGELLVLGMLDKGVTVEGLALLKEKGVI